MTADDTLVVTDAADGTGGVEMLLTRTSAVGWQQSGWTALSTGTPRDPTRPTVMLCVLEGPLTGWRALAEFAMGPSSVVIGRTGFRPPTSRPESVDPG